MKNPELVILAAGMGSRYGGLKQIDTVDDYGHIIIDYSIYDAIQAGFRDITFIIKREIEEDFRAVMDPHLEGKGINVKYVFQEIDVIPEGFSVPEGRTKPWGTAHAILCTLGTVEAPFAVINADDYYGKDAFVKIYDFLKNAEDGEKYSYAMVGYRIKNTVTEKGTVSRGVCTAEGGYLTDIVERTKIGVRDGEIYFTEDGTDTVLEPDTLVSMNFWGFTPSFIRECTDRFPDFLREGLKTNPAKCEFYIPGTVGELLAEGKAEVKVLESVDKWYGVTYKEDKESVSTAFRDFAERGVYPKGF
ncbi:MAG: nucleotidyltransferase [Clostridia bacterium]|nr:nucleotidyltransferase [Clostridia bacterium]